MATWTIRIDMPPKGELEQGGGGVELTDEDMAEESQYRQEFLDYLSPKIEALLARPPRRAANVVSAELQGATTWGRLNHYLLEISVDIGGPGFDPKDLVPPGADVMVIGDYSPLQTWGGRPGEGSAG